LRDEPGEPIKRETAREKLAEAVERGWWTPEVSERAEAEYRFHVYASGPAVKPRP
jgi:hypothetical protein